MVPFLCFPKSHVNGALYNSSYVDCFAECIEQTHLVAFLRCTESCCNHNIMLHDIGRSQSADSLFHYATSLL